MVKFTAALLFAFSWSVGAVKRDVFEDAADRALRKSKGKGSQADVCVLSSNEGFNNVAEVVNSGACERIPVPFTATDIQAIFVGGPPALALEYSSAYSVVCVSRGGYAVNPYGSPVPSEFAVSVATGQVYCCPACALDGDFAAQGCVPPVPSANSIGCPDGSGFLVATSVSPEVTFCCPKTPI